MGLLRSPSRLRLPEILQRSELGIQQLLQLRAHAYMPVRLVFEADPHTNAKLSVVSRNSSQPLCDIEWLRFPANTSYANSAFQRSGIE